MMIIQSIIIWNSILDESLSVKSETLEFVIMSDVIWHIINVWVLTSFQSEFASFQTWISIQIHEVKQGNKVLQVLFAVKKLKLRADKISFQVSLFMVSNIFWG
mgnify:CR=1 FL=1